MNTTSSLPPEESSDAKKPEQPIDHLREIRGLVRDISASLGVSRGNGPGHDHREIGRWDKTGQTCEWCSLWSQISDWMDKTQYVDRPPEPPAPKSFFQFPLTVLALPAPPAVSESDGGDCD
jgi:hypothetical protein